jgi:DnaJ-class molecular chaperone
MKSYYDVCKHCGGLGYVKNYDMFQQTTSALTKPCPVCRGDGSVMVHETSNSAKA